MGGVCMWGGWEGGGSADVWCCKLLADIRGLHDDMQRGIGIWNAESYTMSHACLGLVREWICTWLHRGLTVGGNGMFPSPAHLIFAQLLDTWTLFDVRS